MKIKSIELVEIRTAAFGMGLLALNLVLRLLPDERSSRLVFHLVLGSGTDKGISNSPTFVGLLWSALDDCRQNALG